ncbi:MAG: F0F1 ATP synthase subunit gamma [Geminicoccaceae bacterium]|nr:F0F1 ATP synthase subunit gamma [Geminicoccaceae bacterium]MCS7267666.1 F0F1 ATP synthase subunit gamma [Geminicoccaceae bacterium]MCX7628712.1 F0F1 ATP synthase subunit gamma [Geminicoccaceae bacterium]MDW8123509.1 F0F1 ATP synthase subunit gamma [Geminicoccaceae bacterium]MDW8339850.1 F0F1 ATP synthase subunit gamma [Geminicoccaceae bacterium]
MPSLKDMRNRINSVRATRKITSAMKLVAGSKLRRAQEYAEAARPYAAKMAAMLANLAAAVREQGEAPPLLAGTGKDDTHLIVVATADRGLCGAFNSSIVRATRRRIQELKEQGKTVKLVCVGRKGRDMLRREYGDLIVEFVDGIAGKRRIAFADAERVAAKLLELYEARAFDVATIVFNRFKSAMVQIVTFKQLIPVEAPEAERGGEGPRAIYEFEPDEERILSELLPRNLAVQIYGALLENAASEQGARMVAMDNATRNAGEMIDKLTLRYNRQRQANITKELIEIVSGAEAL